MKRKVNLLKAALVLIAGFVSFVLVLLTFQLFNGKGVDGVLLVFFLSVVLVILLGFRVLYLLTRILNYIKGTDAFSTKTLVVVSKIKWTILVMSIIFLGILPFFYQVADRQDAPGFMIIGLGFVSIPIVAFIFSQIVEELFKSATALRMTDDLTI